METKEAIKLVEECKLAALLFGRDQALRLAREAVEEKENEKEENEER